MGGERDDQSLVGTAQFLRWTKGKDRREFDVHFWRRPLTSMFTAFEQTGFEVRSFIEPMPLEECRDRFPGEWRVFGSDRDRPLPGRPSREWRGQDCSYSATLGCRGPLTEVGEGQGMCRRVIDDAMRADGEVCCDVEQLARVERPPARIVVHALGCYDNRWPRCEGVGGNAYPIGPALAGVLQRFGAAMAAGLSLEDVQVVGVGVSQSP